jgi:HEAT repeat protein
MVHSPRNKVSLRDSDLRRQSLLPIVIALLATLWAGSQASAAGSSTSDPMQEARTAFEHRQYDRALTLVEPLVGDSAGDPTALQLKARTLVKLARPTEALAAYDAFQARTGREDYRLLRDVAFPFIAAVLKDMREQMRGAGYTALKELDSEDAVPYLEDGLSDGSALVRALAVEGLGRLKAGRQSLRLRKAVEDQAGMVRAAALKVLGHSGDRTVLPLVESRLNDEQALVQVTAAGALVMLGKQDGWNRLRQASDASNPEERAAALRMLGELKDSRALQVLQESLTHPQPSVRGAAAAALGDLGVREAVPELTRGLSDTIPAVRVSAAVSLGELSAVDAAPALKQALGDINPAVRAAAASALFRLGGSDEATIGTVRELAQGPDPGIRAAAARSLARLRMKPLRNQTTLISSALKILTTLLDDPVPRPRIAAARALGQIGGLDLVPLLKRALRDQDEAVQATAAGALGHVLDTGG